jgi:hypothetical protein
MKNQLPFVMAGLLLAAVLPAQSPGDIRFNGIATDSTGQWLSGTVGVRLTVLHGSPGGPAEYAEEYADVPLGPGGQFSLPLGLGSGKTGSFYRIDWDADVKYLRVEVRPPDRPYRLLGLPQRLDFDGAASDFTEGPPLSEDDLASDPGPDEPVSAPEEIPANYALRVDQTGEHGLGIQRVGDGHVWEQWIGEEGNLNFWHNGAPAAFLRHGGLWVECDRNLKSNWSELPRVLPEIKHLRPVRYELKGENHGRQYVGFFGREVQEIFPELVEETADKEGNMHLSVQYAGFGVLAVKAIQEQQQTIEYLLRRLEVLEIKVRDLESNR